MYSLKRSLLLLVSSVALLGAALVPALASAQVYSPYNTAYPYSTNCGYTNNYYYGGQYGNQNCAQGTLTVYTQFNNSYGVTQPSGVTLYVAGAASGQQYVTGSQNGSAVWVSGPYSVSLYNQTAYTASYSSGCSGTLMNNQSAVCYVTLTPVYNNSNGYYPQYPYYQPYIIPTTITPVQTIAPVTVVSKYVPSLPNTGFEPISSASVALALVALLAAAFLALPYVRKALASILG